jgi:hypothetical protein
LEARAETAGRPALARGAGPSKGVVLLLQLVTLPLLGFVAFGIGLASGIQSDRIALFGLAIVTGVLNLMVTAVDRTLPRDRRNLLLSIFSFSYFCFIVLPVFVFYVGDSGYHADQQPNPIPLTPADVTRGMLAGLIGYVMLLAGYALPLGRWVSNAVPRMRREWSIETTLAVALLLLPLGWAVTLAYQFGIVPERAGTGVLGSIAQFATFAIGFIVICYQRYRARFAAFLLFLVIPPTMVFYFFSGSKGLFLRPLVLIAVVHVIITRRLRVWWILGFLAVMAAFYPISQTYRSYMYSNHLSTVQVIANPQQAIKLIASFGDTDVPQHLRTGIETTAARLNGLGILSVVVRDTPSRVPYQYGRTLSYIPMSYIPRLFWPGKPNFDIGYWVTTNYGFGAHIESSTGCTWMGELFFNFGWAGLIVGMALMGAWFRFLQESFLGIEATIPAILTGVITILTLASGLGGDMLGATNAVVFAIAPIILIHMLIRLLTPRPVRLPPPL